MALSPLGAIAYVLWYEIPHRMKHVELGDFVVMPNHIHFIIEIKCRGVLHTPASIKGTTTTGVFDTPLLCRLKKIFRLHCVPLKMTEEIKRKNYV